MRKLPGLGAAVLLLAVAMTGPAQEKSDKKVGDAEPNALAWGQGIKVSAAMQTFAVRNPLSMAALRVIAATDDRTAPLLFPEWELALEAPIPLRQKLLELQQDDTRVPNKVKNLQELNQHERAYWAIVDEALIDSKTVRPELFKKAAAENDWATYDHLFFHPNEWRGKVVPVEGRLLRVRKWRPSQRVQEAGIEFVYEGFIAGQTPHRPPYWVFFTTLPEGLQVRETMSRPVKFYGYFIKRVVYPAEKVERKTNLLIGPTVYLTGEAQAKDETPFSRDVLYIAVGGLFGIAVVLGALHLFFRRGDRAIHSRLNVLRDNRPLGIGDDEEGRVNGAPADATAIEAVTGPKTEPPSQQ